jgi:hypothetical protein
VRNRGETIFFPWTRQAGEEEDPRCLQNGTVSAPFFNEQCMKQRRFGKNTPFHLNENGAKLM